MAKYIKEIARKLADGSYENIAIGKQSDWNQNNETEIDYVKNRTHYETLLKETSFFSTSLIVEKWIALEGGEDEKGPVYGYNFTDSNIIEDLDISEGRVFFVRLGNEEYALPIIESYNNKGFYYVGSPYLASLGHGFWVEENITIEDDTFPFAIVIRDSQYHPYIGVLSRSNAYDYVEYALGEVSVVKLDNKYLDLENIDLSKLNNDIGFITNSATNLVAYYDKNQTYNKEEIDNFLDAITTLDIQVITEFPESPNKTTIYLKGTGTDGNNDYEEWLYTDSGWELIGTTNVDLTNYYTKTEIDNLLTTSGGSDLTLVDPQPYEDIV